MAAGHPSLPAGIDIPLKAIAAEARRAAFFARYTVAEKHDSSKPA